MTDASRFEHGFGAELDAQAWTQLAVGLREKLQVCGGRRFRLLEFSTQFREPDWCRKAHMGFVLAGEIVVDIAGEPTNFRKGDILNLPAGVPHRHIKTVDKATLFLIEETDDAKQLS